MAVGADSSTITLNLSELEMYIRPGERWSFTATKTTGGTSGVVGVGISWLDRP
jgi:hypothetical protein